MNIISKYFKRYTIKNFKPLDILASKNDYITFISKLNKEEEKQLESILKNKEYIYILRLKYEFSIDLYIKVIQEIFENTIDINEVLNTEMFNIIAKREDDIFMKVKKDGYKK